MQYAVVAAGGVRLRWLEVPGPSEPPRVFIHGLGSAAAAHLVEAALHPALLPARTLLPDLLGHGLSDRPGDFGYTLDDHAQALSVALDTAGVRAADVVGHSLGGAVALVLAHRRPDLVGRLVLAEPNLDPWDGQRSPSIARQSVEEFIGGGFAQLVAEEPGERAAVLRLADPLAVHRSAMALCRGSEPMMREILVGLAVPVTLLWGTRSRPLARPEQLRAAGIPVLAMAGSGHSIPADDPDGFARAVAAALRLPADP